MRVRVYRNLKHGRKAPALYSIMDKSTGRVVERRHSVILSNAKFIVNESGRQRVLKEQRKNVHAFVEGDYDPTRGWDWPDLPCPVSYNPYKAGVFVREGGTDASDAVYTARLVLVNDNGISAMGVNLD